MQQTRKITGETSLGDWSLSVDFVGELASGDLQATVDSAMNAGLSAIASQLVPEILRQHQMTTPFPSRHELLSDEPLITYSSFNVGGFKANARLEFEPDESLMPAQQKKLREKAEVALAMVGPVLALHMSTLVLKKHSPQQPIRGLEQVPEALRSNLERHIRQRMDASDADGAIVMDASSIGLGLLDDIFGGPEPGYFDDLCEVLSGRKRHSDPFGDLGHHRVGALFGNFGPGRR